MSCLEIEFCNFFCLIFIWLSQNHESSRKFDRLTWGCFRLFFIWSFFLIEFFFAISSFNIDFIWFFSLLFIWLSQYHESRHKFDKLTRGCLRLFFIWFFFFAISSFNISFIENWVSWFFLLVFYRVILVSGLGLRVWQVCLGWLELFFGYFLLFDFFFQIHVLILVLLSIEFHDFFLLAFYGLISIS